MSQTTDFITELVRAANTIHAVTPFERRRLIESGVSVIKAQRELLLLHGNVVPIQPSFMQDMGTLAAMAEKGDDTDVLIGAGMLMLAGEIQRLRILSHASSS